QAQPAVITIADSAKTSPAQVNMIGTGEVHFCPRMVILRFAQNDPFVEAIDDADIKLKLPAPRLICMLCDLCSLWDLCADSFTQTTPPLRSPVRQHQLTG